LKTPLAVLQNEVQTSNSKLSEVVGRQTQTMKLGRTLERIYRDKAIDFDIDLEPGLVFRGEKRDLEEMAGNLMDNACKWTKSAIHVSAKIQAEDEGKIIITISDDGSGMSEDQYEEAIKRGARLDEATPGSGLGLAIVDECGCSHRQRRGIKDLLVKYWSNNYHKRPVF